MTTDKLVILMSTYNGELFLEEQINSILNQTYKNFDLFIRDDGSTDNTVKIINNFARKYPNIKIIKDKDKDKDKDKGNMGPKESFMYLLKLVGNGYDYYSYADQDDIWNNNKLERAVSSLKGLGGTKPKLYLSTYDVVDSSLNLLFKRNLHTEIPLTIESTIINRCPSGCTMVYNKALANFIINSTPKSFRMHDFWTLLTAFSVDAEIFIDEDSTMLYRQHETNSVGYSENNYSTRVKRLFFSAIHNKNERQMQAKSILDNYDSLLSYENRNQVLKVVKYRKSLKNKVILLKDKKFKTNNLYQNILFKLSVLMGLF